VFSFISDNCKLLVQKIAHTVVRVAHVAFERDGHWLATLRGTQPDSNGFFADECTASEMRVDAVLSEHLPVKRMPKGRENVASISNSVRKAHQTILK
jgi:hypothetical protein